MPRASAANTKARTITKTAVETQNISDQRWWIEEDCALAGERTDWIADSMSASTEAI
jgi:hypothetical protein